MHVAPSLPYNQLLQAGKTETVCHAGLTNMINEDLQATVQTHALLRLAEIAQAHSIHSVQSAQAAQYAFSVQLHLVCMNTAPGICAHV